MSWILAERSETDKIAVKNYLSSCKLIEFASLIYYDILWNDLDIEISFRFNKNLLTIKQQIVEDIGSLLTRLKFNYVSNEFNEA